VEAEAVVNKSGEQCIQVMLGRSTDGLAVKVWAQPKVEDFVRSLGTGEHLDVNTIGRHWSPMKKKEPPETLLVYEMSRPIGTIHVQEHGFSFSLDQPGWPLVLEHKTDLPSPYEDSGLPRRYAVPKKSHSELLNLAFLRLVGISSADVVRFVVNGVYTREGIDNLAMRIEQAGSRFYREFLKPYRVIVTVSTMPIPEGF
jgi:hypothetical protein